MTRLLSSTRLTVVLCLLMAAAGVAGSLLYDGNTAFGERGGFNVFRSPVFLVPAALLIVNILFCTASRLRSRPLSAPATWSFAGLHAGLILLAAGLCLDGLRGFVATQYYPVGVPAASHFDWREGKERSFPFLVTVTDVRERLYPVNLKVGVRDAAGRKLGLFTVREGASFRVREAGLRVTPRKFDPATRTLRFDAEAGGRSYPGQTAGPSGSAPVAGFVVVPVSWHDPEVAEYIARVRFSLPDAVSEEAEVRVNRPATFGGITFCFSAVRQDGYGNRLVGLQMTREPGAPWFWAGVVLFGLSLAAHLSLRGRGGRAEALPE